ncbi:BTAD domain-containing putative transcriptional regulator [Micromonospora aurantiaca]|uniref:BTAD domain-containing putative transcriptional regulator n=1 Tax=Micromonospora aurantiaca (nom. illeg.) TaxID=47850 RepID=UPI003406B474
MTSSGARAAAVATSVLSTVAIAVVMVMQSGWTPHLPALAIMRQWIADPMSSGVVALLAAAGAVALWLLLATVVLTHAYASLARRLRRAPALCLPGPVQGLTAALLGATAVTTATGAVAHATAVTVTSDELAAAGHATASPVSHRPAASHQPAAPPSTYTVRRGDSLCGIAARTLGDADRWPEIFALNRGARFPHVGGALRNPDLIYPGWVLRLPTDANHRGDQTRPQRHDQQPRTQSGRPDAPAPPTNPDSSGGTPTPTTTTTAGPTAPATQPPPTGPDATTSAPGTARVTPPSRGASQPPVRAPLPTPHRSPGIDVPGGSWVDIGLATAIAAAAALVWAHRRRRYTPRPPSTATHVEGPDTTPMPTAVMQIRRRLRGAAPRTATPPTTGHQRHDLHSSPDPIDGNTGPDAAAHDGEDHTDGDPTPVPRPAVPSLAHPLPETWPPAGLGLTGPGADAAARGFLTAALAAGGLDAPHERTQVVMPAATATTLLATDTATLPHTPRLTVTTSAEEALDLIEAQILHRSRLVEARNADTVADLRTLDPAGEPLPPVLLLTHTIAARQDTRIAALLTQGTRLDIHGVLLGAWPDGDTVAVAADGTTALADGPADRNDRPAPAERLAVLTSADTLALLGVLAESHTGQPPAPIDAAPQPDDRQPATANSTEAGRSAPAETPRPAATPTPTTASTSPTPVEATGRNPATAHPHASDGSTGIIDTRPHPIAETHAAADAGGHDTAPSAEQANVPPAVDGEQRQPRRVQVSVLGPPSITDAASHPPLRAKALEVLVYLAVHDGEATVDAILDDLLPDAPTSKAPGRLYTYVSNLRAVLRHTAGPGDHLTHPQNRYTLNPALVDVDLWRMRAAIRDAERATDPQARIAALQRAVDTYRGHLADGVDYEWIEPYREAVRQQALDTYLALADALADHPAHQLTVLDEAIRHSPYTEELYQHAMRARAALGQTDAIRSLRRALTRALAEIDAEPHEDSLALANELIAAQQRPRPRPQAQRHTRDEDGAIA